MIQEISRVIMCPAVQCPHLTNHFMQLLICIVSYQIHTRVLIFKFWLYCLNYDSTSCSSSIMKNWTCQFWKYFCARKQNIFSHRSQWPSILAYRMCEWFQSSTNVVTWHTFQEYLKSIWSKLAAHSVFIFLLEKRPDISSTAPSGWVYFSPRDV